MADPDAPEEIEANVTLLHALAHGVRLQLLRALVEEERSVSDIEALTGIGQPGLSQQLAVLRKAELVSTRREAKQIFYSLNRARFADLAGLLDSFSGRTAEPGDQAVAARMAGVPYDGGGIATTVASLDLLFIAVFSMGQLASMAISLMLSMGLYLSFRRWLLTQLPRPDSLSMEQVFQQLYRIARQIEQQPESANAAMSRLMRDLFDPLDVTVAEGPLHQVTLKQDGGLMLVPVPSLTASAHARRTVLVVKHARRGQHLFTRDDCSLAQRIVEQLQRALSFDQAVEQGRSEERLRIAQDLHDDIGARLLTLMYQAPSPEIEEYIRHTIQDLKTLTRGLAAHTHCLSQAAGEWKSDISHRLSVARCELEWQVQLEREIGLNVVQWSALTRILRELVSNTISHAQARRVQVSLCLQEDTLRLTVCDDGIGIAPEAWSHGLGLGGVRKRVKQLGGGVRWSVREPHGICCEVEIPNFAGACPDEPVDQVAGQASSHASH